MYFLSKICDVVVLLVFSKWMWSLSLSITSILKSDNSAMFSNICFMLVSISPVNILFLYLHTKMMWYLMRNFE